VPSSLAQVIVVPAGVISAYAASGNNKGKKAADVKTDNAANKRKRFIIT
jgi:hypothetical protein